MSNDAHRAELLSRERAELACRSPDGISGTAPGEPMRLFVAIAPPPDVLDELDALTGSFRAGRPDLRWTSREAWHVTLAFLGQADEEAASRLLPGLEHAARGQAAFRLAFRGAGAFPDMTRANVLWSGRAGDRAALAGLAESVAAGAVLAGTPPPGRHRTFQPHLTLARCRMPADVTQIVAALDTYAGPPWTADRMHLVRSRRGATDQPRYVTLASWPLRAPDSGPEHAAHGVPG